MELNLIPEEIPKVTRVGGSGREPERWEEHLAPIKETPGISYRVWTYAKRTSAVSRMTSVRDRLTKAVPYDNWTMAVRAVPETDPETYGVYVQFNGQFTDEQVAENARLHAERSARVRASRVTAEPEPEPQDPSEPAPEPQEPTEPPSGTLSARQRVQAARERQKAS